MKFDSPLFDRIRVKPGEDRRRNPDAPCCDWKGCGNTATHRAPKGRTRENEYWRFCLDHVREYNAAWNYYAGMSEAEIEAEIRSDTVWQRPTWPLGSRLGARIHMRWEDYGLLDPEEAAERARERARPKTPQEEALAVFSLELPLTLPGLKARYKELVKRHHPDSHGGDKAAEEKLKVINQAYSTLKSSYFTGL